MRTSEVMNRDNLQEIINVVFPEGYTKVISWKWGIITFQIWDTPFDFKVPSELLHKSQAWTLLYFSAALAWDIELKIGGTMTDFPLSQEQKFNLEEALVITAEKNKAEETSNSEQLKVRSEVSEVLLENTLETSKDLPNWYRIVRARKHTLNRNWQKVVIPWFEDWVDYISEKVLVIEGFWRFFQFVDGWVSYFYNFASREVYQMALNKVK